MIMSVIEAHIAEEHWAALQDAYASAAQQLAPGIVQSFLVHNLVDRSGWQIMTIWASFEAVQATRQSGQTPPAILMFRAAGAEPTHSVFEIARQANAS